VNRKRVRLIPPLGGDQRQAENKNHDKLAPTDPHVFAHENSLQNHAIMWRAMTKRILLLFCVLAVLILPADAASKAHRHKHSASRSRKSKSKSMRKSTHHSKARRAKH
jgi:hypothetical protein